jgi:DNA-binding LacI/PurR family transcriptional regulator
MKPSGRATISDVAARAGVSRTTVSKLFNGHGSVSEATAVRIRDAAAKLNWTPSAAAVALRSSRARTVGLVVNRNLGVTTAESLISGIEYVLSRHGYGLLYYEVDAVGTEEAELYRRLADTRKVDGVILTNSRVGDTRFKLMRDIGLPAVLIGTPWRDDPIPHLDAVPPGAGVPESVAHLAQLGHRHIAYVGGPEDQYQALARHRAFEAAMVAAGLKPFAVVETDYSPHMAADVTDRLLSRKSAPSAIIYAGDRMAIAGMHTARRRGLKLPEDLSIVGFDGIEVGAWVEPSLTTVERDPTLRGRAVAAMLLRLLGEDFDDEYPLPTQTLTVRRSTAPPRA